MIEPSDSVMHDCHGDVQRYVRELEDKNAELQGLLDGVAAINVKHVAEHFKLMDQNAELLSACEQAISITPFWLRTPTDTDESGECAALHLMFSNLIAAIGTPPCDTKANTAQP